MATIPMSIYAVLFLIALIPPLLGKKPYTYYFSKGKFPQGIVKSDVFIKINTAVSYAWAFIFALAFILVQIEYSPYSSTNTLIANAMAYLPQIIIGIPASIYLPRYLLTLPGYKLKFESLKDAFEAMPHGLNKKSSKGVDVIIQLELTGDEAQDIYIAIKNRKCQCINGIHTKPTLTIKIDSTLWLNIINGNVDGTEAYLNKRYEMIGDASIMLKFEKLFNTGTIKTTEDRVQDYKYKTLTSKKIKNIVVFDGGPRNKKFSKTTLMVDKFIEGAKSAGANIEEYKLAKLDIHHCDGCYMCWTKIPGQCVHKDIMTELREKYRSADLVVFASPLYIFNVTGIMKNFMDRLLPLLKPYMLLDKDDGHITHPDRFPELGEQGMVIFSASGFPDVDGNFDGLKGMYRAWDSHNENSHLMGEFFLTAAEMLPQPVYKSRRNLVEESCFNAGVQVVNEGKIDYKYMATVSNPRVDNKTFQNLADNFWMRLDGKKSYLKEMIKI
ncbi:Iron-sulfur flavoprotein [hydrothermal vent metagenome]|uniref:Iron-sulfur flavoprotein n=1 Tax=hydrothermal vent metagenome TaxID=652676 RepID=A0A3B1DSX7_9ZZZZ